MTTQNSKIIFDIECNGLNPTTIHCIVAKELNGTLYKFTPDKIKEGLDFLSNGFKVRGYDGTINAYGTYIYMAFAENPLVTSTGIPTTAR